MLTLTLKLLVWKNSCGADADADADADSSAREHLSFSPATFNSYPTLSPNQVKADNGSKMKI